ncbi:hypothetical protein RFI_38227 [Reticulomyxa filosa]|uniref:Uncharacterized protein n=1 Tax=Reticulomyxa filosa TaxID=46433 RepID=X6LET9_RETFI|nr:hypothetical protein RFI_38227 [Reticulomyxa filosa]|eukprot:ETN99254.1 hypothetical protein RFI_38227 [Reticulomyxa filosa]
MFCVQYFGLYANGYIQYLYTLYYIDLFQRLNPPKVLTKLFGGKTATNLMLVRMIGALWHGVYPGIYLFYFFTFFVSIMVDTYQSFLPTYHDFEHKGVRAWLWRIFWTVFTFFPVYTVLPFFMVIFFCFFFFFICLSLSQTFLFHLDTPKLITVVNSIYWWFIPVIPLMNVVGNAMKKIVGAKTPPSAAIKTTATTVEKSKAATDNKHIEKDTLSAKKKD